jgi:hypothetical protein
MLAYAYVCGRMRTYAYVCDSSQAEARMLAYADVCGRMLRTYATLTGKGPLQRTSALRERAGSLLRFRGKGPE